MKTVEEMELELYELEKAEDDYDCQIKDLESGLFDCYKKINECSFSVEREQEKAEKLDDLIYDVRRLRDVITEKICALQDDIYNAKCDEEDYAYQYLYE